MPGFRQFLTKIFSKRGKIEPKMTHTRAYSAARITPATTGWSTPTSSADIELKGDLARLRDRSRALVRDAAYAKRAKVIIINNVVGSGIGLQGQVMNARGGLNRRVNDAIEAAFDSWSYAARCHTGGVLCFPDIERLAMGQIFEAGEILIRKHYRAFGDSKIPFALEIIESERLPVNALPLPIDPTSQVRMGVEVDGFQRPVAYWIRKTYPSEYFSNGAQIEQYERVPAEQIFHLKLTDRWPQTRGEPWLHTMAKKLNDMDAYSDAEIVAARGAANFMLFIETPEPDSPIANEPTTSGDSPSTPTLQPGTSVRLAPGEKPTFANPTRPNAAMDPFMRMMVREAAAGIGVSYESLSRDYSQSNYSSSRLALLDDRDLWKCLQRWFIRSFREPLHAEWLRQAVYAGAIPEISLERYLAAPEKMQAARFKPRGWSWVDPTKEVEAYKQAVGAGFMTVGDVIALTGDGRDLEDVLADRRRELDLMAEYGLNFDTAVPAKGAAAPAAASSDPPPPDSGNNENSISTTRPARVVSLGRS
jgi:lambda family phage portal protein